MHLLLHTFAPYQVKALVFQFALHPPLFLGVTERRVSFMCSVDVSQRNLNNTVQADAYA